jgi:lactoylglutathione lyase
MRTLHLGLRVADRERSLAFYTAVGYEVVGEVPETPIGHLTMLKLPSDQFVTIELVHRPTTRDDVPPSTGPLSCGLSHFVIAVDSMDTTVRELTSRGIDVEDTTSPDDSEHFLTTWITDPDGNRIELVQWPPDHPGGITAGDWPE